MKVRLFRQRVTQVHESETEINEWLEENGASIDIRFIEPYLFDSVFSGSVRVFDRLSVYDQFSQNSLGGSLTLGYPLVRPELTASLTYTLKNDEISTSTTSTFFGTASAVSLFRRALRGSRL